MMKQFAKLLIIASAVGIATMPAMSVAKTPTCHQEAKKAGIKGTAEVKKYVHECLEKRRHAKKAMKSKKKMEKKKEDKK